MARSFAVAFLVILCVASVLARSRNNRGGRGSAVTNGVMFGVNTHSQGNQASNGRGPADNNIVGRPIYDWKDVIAQFSNKAALVLHRAWREVFLKPNADTKVLRDLINNERPKPFKTDVDAALLQTLRPTKLRPGFRFLRAGEDIIDQFPRLVSYLASPSNRDFAVRVLKINGDNMTILRDGIRSKLLGSKIFSKDTYVFDIAHESTTRSLLEIPYDFRASNEQSATFALTRSVADFEAEFRRAPRTRDELANWLLRKLEDGRYLATVFSALHDDWLMRPLNTWVHNNTLYDVEFKYLNFEQATNDAGPYVTTLSLFIEAVRKAPVPSDLKNPAKAAIRAGIPRTATGNPNAPIRSAFLKARAPAKPAQANVDPRATNNGGRRGGRGRGRN